MVKTQEIIDQKTWEKFVLVRPEANFLHSWSWGEFYKRLGNRVRRVGFYRNGKLVGVIQGVVERARRATYMTVGGGPLFDWGSREMVKCFRETAARIAEEEKCSFVRARPQILENEQNSKTFSQMGFVQAPMHLHAELTYQLDLTGSEEEILAGMRKTTRYEIKQAVKLGIEVKTGGDIGKFYDLQIETAKRQAFVPFGRKYLEEQFRIFSEAGQCLLYTAYLGKKKLAQAMVIFYGQEADYHYGASSEEGRKYPGAYLIQWEAIKEAKRRGMERYNFWGVAPEGQTKHRFYGVSVFKRGFGGEDVTYLHARDLVIDWKKYSFNWLVEILRKKIRNV